MAVFKPIVLDNGQLEVLQPGDTLEGAVPTGGTTGQMLVKASSTNFDLAWGRVITSGTAAPTGGNDGDIYFQHS